jgi:hypothetical protein
LLGYKWRDLISQQRRAQYLAKRFVRELEREREAKASSDSTELG